MSIIGGIICRGGGEIMVDSGGMVNVSQVIGSPSIKLVYPTYCTGCRYMDMDTHVKGMISVEPDRDHVIFSDTDLLMAAQLLRVDVNFLRKKLAPPPIPFDEADDTTSDEDADDTSDEDMAPPSTVLEGPRAEA